MMKKEVRIIRTNDLKYANELFHELQDIANRYYACLGNKEIRHHEDPQGVIDRLVDWGIVEVVRQEPRVPFILANWMVSDGGKKVCSVNDWNRMDKQVRDYLSSLYSLHERYVQVECLAKVNIYKFNMEYYKRWITENEMVLKRRIMEAQAKILDRIADLKDQFEQLESMSN